MRVSRGFVSFLGGIGMTLFAWYGPWEWPAWPAFTTIDLVFGKGVYADLPFAQRAAALVALILLNSGFWAVILRLLIASAEVVRKRIANTAT